MGTEDDAGDGDGSPDTTTCHECGVPIRVAADETEVDALVAHFEREHHDDD
ncbi:hypothetical protein [Haloglomus salinum]|uniref:hypothetical protein n=1 Tax=Haloglomus salinum TaxID=2962673 RepID=UPI0020C9CB5F|nr:hypothetical protein [Haloglomus salinum]